jgi:hypothetical protein
MSSSLSSSSLGSRYGRSARSNKQRRDQDTEQRREQQQRQQAHPQRRQQQRWHMYPPEQSAHSQPPGPEYALSFAIPKSQVTKETTGETHTLNFGNDWYNENDERQHQAKMDIETSLTMENTVFRRPSWERNDDDSRASFNSRSIDGGSNNNNSAAAFTRSSMAASTTVEFETLTLPNDNDDDDDDDDQSRFSSVAGHSSMGHSSLVFAPSVTSAAPTVKQSNRSFQRPMFLKKRAVTTATTTPPPPRRGQRQGIPLLRPAPLPFVPPAPLSIAARMESTVVATMEASPVAATTTTATSGTAPPPFTTRPVLAISALGTRPTLPIPRNPPFQRNSVSSSLVVTAPSTPTTTTTTAPSLSPLARSTPDQSRRAGPEHAMDVGDIPMKASFRSLASATQSHQAPPPPPPPSLSHHSTHSTIRAAVSRTKPAPTTASMNLDLPNPYLDEDDAYSRRHSNPYDMEVASHGAMSGPASAGLQCSSRRVRLVLLGGVIVLVGVVLAVVLVLPRTKSQSLVTNNAPSPPTTVPINVSSHNSTHNNHTNKAPVNTAAVAPSRMPPTLATTNTISPTVAPPQTVPPTVMLTFAPTLLIAGTATATTSTARTTGNVHDRT